MKNEVTFQIEHKQLNQLLTDNHFEEADNLCSRMLRDYNQFDYELLLKRARIRQCLMRYEEASLDANLALHVLPQRIDAYYVLSDFLVAMNNYPEALKILDILYHHDPSNIIIKGQYEQIKEKEKKRQQRSQTKIETKYNRQQELKLINKEKFQQIKEFLEKSYDEEQKPVSKPIGLQFRERIDDDKIVLSDEMLEDSDNDSLMMVNTEKPGNAQHLETPRVQQQLDFREVSADELFGKKKEVYRMKPEKLAVVQCQLCSLLFDYTSTCSHYSQLTQEDIDDLKEMMPGIAGHRDINSKKQALQKVTRSLDVLSTFKVTSLTLLQGQFSEIIALYLKRDLSILLGENSEFICQECCPIQKDDNNKPQITLAQHALIIVNRSLTFQQQALMLNQKEDLINVGGLEEEKANFRFEPRIATAILEEMKIELDQSQARNYQNLNFQTLQLLVRALTNLLILTPEQAIMLANIRKHDIIKRLLQVLNSMNTDILQDKQSQAPQLCLLIPHTLRLLILCHSIDQSSVQTLEEPSLKQILRKYDHYDKAFPQNSKLMNALKGDYLWFNHSNQGCNMKNFYKDAPLRSCGNCTKSSRDLKACSRCLKVYYCNRDCQKAHYSKHKSDCLQAVSNNSGGSNNLNK